MGLEWRRMWDAVVEAQTKAPYAVAPVFCEWCGKERRIRWSKRKHFDTASGRLIRIEDVYDLRPCCDKP